MSARTELFTAEAGVLDPPVIGAVAMSTRQRMVRRAAVGVLAADLAAVLVAGVVVVSRPDHSPVLGRRVVDAQCIDHHVVDGLDIGAPGGLLAWDTGVACK